MAASAVLVVAGCTGGSGDDAPPTRVEQSIGPAGGELRSGDQRLRLIVPDAALAAAQNLTIETLDTEALPQALRDLGVDAAYDLGPDGLTFDAPVRVSLTVASDQVARGDPMRLPLGTLVVEGAGGALEPLANQTISGDAGAGTVSIGGDLEHFSTVAGFGLSEGERGAVAISGVPPELAVGASAELLVELVAPASSEIREVQYRDRVADQFQPPEPPPFQIAVPFDTITGGGQFWRRSLTYRCAAEGVDDYAATVTPEVRTDTSLGFVDLSVVLPPRNSVADPFSLPVSCVAPAADAVDADNDGVADSADQCPGTSPGAPVDEAGCSSEQLASPDLIPVPLTGLEGLALLPNPWAGFIFTDACAFVIVAVGADGIALIDPCARDILAILPLPDNAAGLLGITPLEPLEDINGQTLFWLLAFGESGWYLQQVIRAPDGTPAPGQTRPPVDGPTEGTTTAAQPAGNATDTGGGAQTTVVTEALRGRLALESADLFSSGAYNGFATDDEAIAEFAEGDFPDADGAPVTGWLGGDRALAVTQGAGAALRGNFYSFSRSPISGNFLTGELEGEVGADPRDLLVRENPAPAAGEGVIAGAVVNFGSDSMTLFSVAENGAVKLGPDVPAGDGPVNGDLRITDENTLEGVAVGFNDGRVYLARYDWNANLLAGASGAVPDGCGNPVDIRFDPTDPDIGWASCNASARLARVDLGGIRASF